MIPKDYKIVEISCQFCGNSRATTVYVENHWSIVKCGECSNVYTNPRPQRSDLFKFYSESYFNDERHRVKFYSADGLLNLGQVSYANRIQDVETFAKARTTVLEIGAARGDFLKILQERGWKVSGVEISFDAVEIARQMNGLDLYCGELENFESTTMFDTICMYQTLEHVWNPKTTIEKCHKLLSENGILIVEVPHRKAFEMLYSKKRKHLSYDLPRHLTHFTPKFLKHQLENLGFEVLKVERYHSKVVLKLLSLLAKAKRILVKASQSDQEKISEKVLEICSRAPMAVRQNNIKAQLLSSIAQVIPGWRFTIFARKKKS